MCKCSVAAEKEQSRIAGRYGQSCLSRVARSAKTRLRGGSALQKGGCLGSGPTIVNDGHEGAGHASGIGVLNDVSSVNNSGGTLLNELFRALEDFLVWRLAAAANEDRYAASDFDDLAVNGDVIGRVSLDDVSAEFDGLANEWEDFFEIAINHVATGLLVGLKDERFDHKGHGVAIAFRLDAQNVENALVGYFGLLGYAEKIDDDAGGIKAQGLLDRLFDHAAEESSRERCAINVGDVGAKDQSGFLFAGKRLEVVSLADGELNGVGRRLNEGLDGRGKILNPL